MNFIIKNMVCPRCIEAVKKVFATVGIPISTVTLGNVASQQEVSPAQKKQLQEQLTAIGFELLDDKQSQLINKIKSIVIHAIHHQEEGSPINFSSLLSETLHYDYAYLSRLFSSVEGRTIEKFTIAQKIEKVKELLTYKELTLSEIAYRMNYSSTAHLSAQFKKVTGMSPTAFKQLQQPDRRFLDNI